MSIALNGNHNFAIKQQYQSTPARFGSNEVVVFKLFDDFDKFEPTTVAIKQNEPTKINIARILFHRLTPEQIKTINETRQLPKNAKIVDAEVTGEPKLTWNAFDIIKGTHTLPAGYELKQDILGFTHVVREDSKAWYLKKD